MTAIQILEKLGADASFHPNKLTHDDKCKFSPLIENGVNFNAILSHSPAEDDEDDEDDLPEEKIFK